MSPRAACRLEAIGFEEVYDYTAGIADWKAAGLDLEGSEDQGLRIADATRAARFVLRGRREIAAASDA